MCKEMDVFAQVKSCFKQYNTQLISEMGRLYSEKVKYTLDEILNFQLWYIFRFVFA